MQHAMARPSAASRDELMLALPLYAASLVVTLAGVGAVGVTFSAAGWTPIWAFLAVLGHLVSLGLRRLRVPMEVVFYPVAAAGFLLLVQLVTRGNVALGVDMPFATFSPDMSTAMAVGTLAVIRTFTLLNNGALLFSAVPAITMLALVGTSNPNAEVPLFFGLLVLGSLFLCGYEAHLRRIQVTNRSTAPLLLHLLGAWCVTLAVAAGAILFPVALQPVLGPLSPFTLPALNRLRGLVNFTQATSNQAPVGQGPITLNETPVYEVYAQEGGLLRTTTYSSYTGRSWTSGVGGTAVDVHSDSQAEVDFSDASSGISTPNLYKFQFRPDPDREVELRRRSVRQIYVTRGYGANGIPGLGRIVGLLYPRDTVYLQPNGSVSGHGHLAPSRTFQVESEVVEYEPALLRQSPAVDPSEVLDPEVMSLPQSTLPVQQLTRELVAAIPNPYDRIQAILAYIEKNCHYTLQEDVTPQGEDAATYYLLKSKRGACDLAATAAAVMCRAAGIPARVAVGYVAMEKLPDGSGFLVRQAHAHMWMEAYLAGFGWVPFDPAPPLLNINDTPWDVLVQRVRGILGKIGGGGLDALLLVLLVAITLALAGYQGWKRLRVWLRTRQRRLRAAHGSPAAAVALTYHHAMRLLDRRGWARAPSMTPREYLRWLQEQWSPGAEALRTMGTLTDLFQQAHYAESASPESLARAQAALRELRRQVPQRPRPAGERFSWLRGAGPRVSPAPAKGTPGAA